MKEVDPELTIEPNAYIEEGSIIENHDPEKSNIEDMSGEKMVVPSHGT